MLDSLYGGLFRIVAALTVVVSLICNCEIEAACPITHAYLTKIFFKKFPKYTAQEEQEFMLGTLFPDIRCLGEVERAETHYDQVTLKEVLEEPNVFLAGMKFHSYVDLVREELVVREKIYDKLRTKIPELDHDFNPNAEASFEVASKKAKVLPTAHACKICASTWPLKSLTFNRAVDPLFDPQADPLERLKMILPQLHVGPFLTLCQCPEHSAGDTPYQVMAFLKLIEDDFLYNKDSWNDLCANLTYIHPEERKYGIPDISITRWHKLLNLLFVSTPSYSLSLFSLTGKGALSMTSDEIKTWNLNLKPIGKDPLIISWMDSMISHFKAQMDAYCEQSQ